MAPSSLCETKKRINKNFMPSAVWKPKRSSANNMSFLLSEVQSLSTGTQRPKPYGQDCMRLGFREAVNKTGYDVNMILGLRSGATKLWDLGARV
jgi:hypothetical protein